MLHLVFGNALIGLLEGQLLATIFKCSKCKSILILIAANYLSAWAGGFIVASHLPSLVDITIENIQLWFLAFVVIAFVATLLLEFPFFWCALGKRKRRLRRAITATIVVNAISYTLLFGWYWMASGTSIMSDLEVVPESEMQLTESYTLYYISRSDDAICRMELGDLNSKQRIAEVSSQSKDDRLFVRPREGEAGFDLFVRLDQPSRDPQIETLLLEDFAEQAPVEWRLAEENTEGTAQAAGSWFNFGMVPAIGKKSDWEFRTGFWPIEGLSGQNEKTGERRHFSLELPFVAWSVRNATQITGDYVLAQLGDDQICLIHPKSRKIALLLRGKGPIVVKAKPTQP
jgi:hypothetical protein